MKYSRSLRLWHWLNALIITGSLLTVLLNSSLFDVRANTTYVQQELLHAGATVTPEQAQSVAHGLEDKVWGIHIYFGYALAGLFLFRVVMEFFQPQKQWFFGKLKAAWLLYRNSSKNAESSIHDFIVKALYLAFYLVLALMVVTGLTLAFEDNLGISRTLSNNIKEVHGFSMYLVLAFIVVHIVGVILAERNTGKGMVSDMINGGKQ